MRPISRRAGFPLCIWAALAALGAPASAQETGTITGRVIDRDGGGAVAAVLVEIPGTRFAVVTNGEGRFTLPDIPAGPVAVRFSWLGYAPHDTSMVVRPGAAVSLDVALDARPVELAAIEVTSVSRAPERVVGSPAAVSVVEPGRVSDVAANNQGALLIADLPGVQVAQGGVNQFVVNTRSFMGLANRRMLVLVDGRDIAANFANSPEWAVINPTEPGTEIELIRGPGSALYGANAFGGVLNIRTPSIRETPGARMSVGAGELSSYDVRGRWAGVTDDLRWGLRVRGGYSESRGYDRARTDLGDLADEYAGATDGAVNTPQPGYELIPLNGQIRESPLGLPGASIGEPDPQTTIDGSVRVERYFETGGLITAEGGITRVENQVSATGASRVQIDRSDVPWARLALDRRGYSVMAYYGGRSGTATDLQSGVDVEDRSSRFHLEGQLNRGFADERVRGIVGASLRSESVDSEGTILAPEFDGRSDEYYSLFGQLAWDVASDLELSVVGRWDSSSLWDDQFAPRAALVWTVADQHTLRGTFGRAYLVPSVAGAFVRVALGPPVDLGAVEAGLRASPLGPALAGVPNGALFDTSSDVPILAIGNPYTEPESVDAVEFGYKGQFGRAFATADLHYSRFDAFETNLLPGVHPDFAPWTAPAVVPASAAGALADAANATVPGLTRLENGASAIVFSRVNAGEATQWGLDLSLGIRLSDEILVSGNYSYVTIDLDESSFLDQPRAPNTPEQIANFSSSWTRPDGLRLRAALHLVESFEFRDGVWEGGVPGRQTVDLDARGPLGDDLTLGISLVNAFDQSRFHYYGGSIIGRRLMASLVWSP